MENQGRLYWNRIRTYYRLQQANGNGYLAATFRLPGHGLQQWRLWLKYPTYVKTLHGFRQYDLPLLASYSRSGTNWVRYFLESVTERPTPGQPRIYHGDNYCIDRAHRAFKVMPRYQKVVLLVRDYRECILRHHRDIWSAYPDPTTLLMDEGLEQPPLWYIRNLQAFDQFQGDKLLLYYEDLVQYPRSTLSQLASFLALAPDRTAVFLQDIETHQSASVQVYKKGGHKSESLHSKDLNHHAKAKLTPGQVREFDEFYFSRYPEIAHKYLARYDKR